APERGVRKVADRLFVRLRHRRFRHGVRLGQHLRQEGQPREEPLDPYMTSHVHSVVQPSPLSQRIAGVIVVLYAVITMVPLAWIFLTGFKSGPDSIAYPPKVLFTPSAEGYCNLFTTRSRQSPEYIAQLPPTSGICDAFARTSNMVVVGASN